MAGKTRAQPVSAQHLLVEAGNAEALFLGLRLCGAVAGCSSRSAGFILLQDGVNECGGGQRSFNSRRVPWAGLLYLGAARGTRGFFFDTDHRTTPERNRKNIGENLTRTRS